MMLYSPDGEEKVDDRDQVPDALGGEAKYVFFYLGLRPH